MYGFVRVGAVVPDVKVGDCEYNAGQIIAKISEASSRSPQILLFPELSVTGFTCGDHFVNESILKDLKAQLARILKETRDFNCVSIIGLPVSLDNLFFNCAVVIQKGRILGVVPKSHIPMYGEQYEQRWFSSGMDAKSREITLCGQRVAFGTDLLFESDGKNKVKFAVEICEDVWVASSPSERFARAGANILFNLSASPEMVGKAAFRRDLVVQQSGKCDSAYVYVSCGKGESSSGCIFTGQIIVAENGALLRNEECDGINPLPLVVADIDVQAINHWKQKHKSFLSQRNPEDIRKITFVLPKILDIMHLERTVGRRPFASFDCTDEQIFTDLLRIQKSAIAQKLKSQNADFETKDTNHAIINVSDPHDSVLALLTMVKAFDSLQIPRNNIIVRGKEADGNHLVFELARKLGIRINASLPQSSYHLSINPDDLSEIAYGRYEGRGSLGDTYLLNGGIPKTYVISMIDWIKTSQLFSEWDSSVSSSLEIEDRQLNLINLNDFFMHHFAKNGFTPEKIVFLATKAFEGNFTRDEIIENLREFIIKFAAKQKERTSLPDVLKVGGLSLSPREDWKVPGEVTAEIFLRRLDRLKNPTQSPRVLAIADSSTPALGALFKVATETPPPSTQTLMV